MRYRRTETVNGWEETHGRLRIKDFLEFSKGENSPEKNRGGQRAHVSTMPAGWGADEYRGKAKFAWAGRRIGEGIPGLKKDGIDRSIYWQ